MKKEADQGWTQEDLDNFTAGKQVIGTLVSLGMAIACGTVAGVLMSKPVEAIKVYVPDAEFYHDRLFFHRCEDYETASPSLAAQAEVAECKAVDTPEEKEEAVAV